MHHPRPLRRFELPRRGAIPVPGLRPSSLDREELEQLTRLVELLGPSKEGYLVRRNRKHRVGRVVVDDIDLVVPPTMAPEQFVVFYLFASGADLTRFAERRPAKVDLVHAAGANVFLQLFAGLLVAEAEELSHRVARYHVDRVARLGVIRGTPIWMCDFGKRWMDGVTCRFGELEVDNLLNQLVLAGIEASRHVLPSGELSTRANAQFFAWSSIANRIRPSLVEFVRARSRMNRLTVHYGNALELSQALVLGFSPGTPFHGRQAPLPGLEFDLPALFESFVDRLVGPGARARGLDPRFQVVEGAAILDGGGKPYRRIRLDTYISRGSELRAVIDAKYKPRYVDWSSAGTRAPVRNRIESEDLYQLFFYQARLGGAGTSPLACIVAPSFRANRPELPAEALSIRWTPRLGGSTQELSLVPLHMPSVLTALARGDSPETVVRRHVAPLDHLLDRCQSPAGGLLQLPGPSAQ